MTSATGSEVKNVLTFDVEEYFHVSAFATVTPEPVWGRCESRVGPAVERILDLLDAHGVRATFFVLGWVAARQPALVRRIAARGHELASHSFAHRLVYEQSRDQFREDVRRARHAVEDAVGIRVLGYRAPSFSVVQRTLWALDILAEEGFAYDSSIFPIRHDRYGIPSAPRAPHRRRTSDGGGIWELPPATARFLGATVPVAGGGYLRHFPPALLHWGIRRMNAVDRLPAVLYLHPWELDADQPRQPVGPLTAWRHYAKLDQTEARLESLLRALEFRTAGDLVAALDGGDGMLSRVA